jgi:hypothetical protein
VAEYPTHFLASGTVVEYSGKFIDLVENPERLSAWVIAFD